MPKARFRQAEIERVIRAARRMGLQVAGVAVDPRTGEIRTTGPLDHDPAQAEAERLEGLMDKMLG